MKTKFTLYFLIMLLFGIKASMAVPPATLSLQGTATENGTAIPMKLIGNVYELYTSLKPGSYSFAGDNSIATVNTTVTVVTPYRIRVNYSGATPVVEAKKIERVILWAPWNQYPIAELAYAGNSSFKTRGITHKNDLWGNNENRYRIKIFLEGSIEETYSRSSSSSGDAPTGTTPQSYFDLDASLNGQWPGGAREFKIAGVYKEDSGLETDGAKVFDAEVIFSTSSNYTHKITDFVASVVLTNSLSISGSAVENATAVFKKSNSGISVFEFVGGLKAGSFTISGTLNNQTYSYTLMNNLVVQGNTAINVTGAVKPYYIRIDLANQTMVMHEVSNVYLYMSRSGYLGADRLLLAYAGSGKFQATKANMSWPSDDGRYKFKMDLINNTSVFWGSVNFDNQTPADNVITGSYYDLLSVNGDDYQYSYKFRNDTKNKQVTVGLDFNANGAYTHKYLIGTTLPLTLVDFKAAEENGKVKLVWNTQNEVNFKEFEVEKSVDGVRFESLGTVQSNNTTGPQKYSLNDHILAASTIYYRLKMIDQDGTLQFSNIIAVKILGFQKDEFAVYYGVDSYLQVVHPIAANNAEIKIFSIDGKLLSIVKVQKGNAASQVNISALHTGVYALGFKDDTSAYRAKFVK